MKEINKQCPFCGGAKFIDGKISAYSGINIKIINENGNSAVHAVVCCDCGSVVRWYVSDAEKLLPKKERKIND